MCTTRGEVEVQCRNIKSSSLKNTQAILFGESMKYLLYKYAIYHNDLASFYIIISLY